ncbi:DUF1240 domain-containing protein [Yersinia alsatica]|uniref:DUF1240 domain-containing protein n=1 Tax=Yersinia TaxID=629 RepID=UPI0005E4C5EB|nr:DUF1240 domain-containing protein [Yersinia frederiksenii]CFR15152.1 Uncharacterised protein [Yersinia frederiksenii]CNK84906.1 Uncharacterised protein [Yersinia frederiksenii]
MAEKLRALLSIFILISLSALSWYLGFSEIFEYFDYYNVVVFSWMAPFLIFIPLLLTFPLLWFFALLFKGYNPAIIIISPIIPLFKVICILAVVFSISLSYWYVTTLSEKGYIRCKGIPSGWMPGMATKYVTSEALCLKKSD